LSRELTPIDGNLNLESLKKSEGELGRDILHILAEKKLKAIKIEEYINLIAELSQSIEDNKTINELPIEEAKREWDLLKDQINDTLHQIELLEKGIEHNKEKLSHLEEHEYDPNCNFCMNNVFVKDAIETQKKVEEQGNQLETLNILHSALVTQAGKIADVEEQWETLSELKSKYQKSIVIKEKAESESCGFDIRVELLEHQLQSVKDNIQKYHDNEETIKRNIQIDEIIIGLQRTKGEIELEIKKITKDIAGVNGSISSISSFIEGIKGKMSDVKELEEKNRLYTYYLDAVKRDGIPYELISKALPVIENEVNNILSQVVDFGVVMDVDGKSINAKIVYDDQEWPLEMSSGMEKFVSGLAIRVALINVCNLPRPNFLVIDEGFGTLDSDNLSSLFMMMQYLKTQFDFIWVISHLEQMRDIVDGLIEIKKENGFSKIDF
jgi:DNA repair exonuclease SbcCD ATPase subunit